MYLSQVPGLTKQIQSKTLKPCALNMSTRKRKRATETSDTKQSRDIFLLHAQHEFLLYKFVGANVIGKDFLKRTKRNLE